MAIRDSCDYLCFVAHRPELRSHFFDYRFTKQTCILNLGMQSIKRLRHALPSHIFTNMTILSRPIRNSDSVRRRGLVALPTVDCCPTSRIMVLSGQFGTSNSIGFCESGTSPSSDRSLGFLFWPQRRGQMAKSWVTTDPSARGNALSELNVA